MNLEWIASCSTHTTRKNTFVREANNKYISSIPQVVNIVKNNEKDEENKGWSPLTIYIVC